MADELTARVYFRRAERILDRAEQSLPVGGAARANLLLEATTNALLAVGMGLGVHLPPLDPAALVADLNLPTNDEGSADATTEPSA